MILLPLQLIYVQIIVPWKKWLGVYSIIVPKVLLKRDFERKMLKETYFLCMYSTKMIFLPYFSTNKLIVTATCIKFLINFFFVCVWPYVSKPDDKCSHFLPHCPFAFLFIVDFPSQCWKMSKVEGSIVWWRQKCNFSVVVVQKMASPAQRKDTQSINISIFQDFSFSSSGLLSPAMSSLQGVTFHIQVLMCRVHLELAWALLHPGLFAGWPG